MKFSHPMEHASLAAAAVVSTLLLATPSSAFTYDCKKIRADKHTFNLSPLRGPHSVTTTRFNDPVYYNTTYTIDVCAPLKHSGEGKACWQNTRICGIQHLFDPEHKDLKEVTGVIPIAGELKPHGGYDMDAEAIRLSTSDSTGDRKKTGLRLVLKGGKHLKQRQKAIIEFLCDHDKEGTEGEWDPEEKYDPEDEESAAEVDILSRRSTSPLQFEALADAVEDEQQDGNGEEGDDQPSPDEIQLRHPNASLVFESYTQEGDFDVLRLTWLTKHACESAQGGDPGAPQASQSWGLFTWLVVIVFLATASYLIFGSWLNYNRYGARGWDLVPHGDTLRDLPYLIRDWARRVLSSVQGGDSRGGYSAV